MKNHERIEQKQEVAPEAQATREPFDPVAELERIRKLPHAKKWKAMDVYKEKLIAQKEDIAELEELLIAEFKKNPDASKAYLLDILEKGSGKLSALQKDMFRTAILDALDRRKIVRELREDYTDDRELFNHLFGFYPSGPIRISTETLYFKIEVYNSKDSAALTEDAFIEGRTPTKEELKESTYIYARALPLYVADVPNYIAVMVNNSPEAKEEPGEWSQEQQLAHEEQHVLDFLFRTAQLKAPIRKAVMESPNATAVDLFVHFLNEIRRYTAEWERKTETLAFLRMGASVETIENELKDQRYSSERFRNIVEKQLKQALGNHFKDFKPIFDEAFDDIFGTELEEIQKRALEGVTMLQKEGIAEDRIILLLANEPFASWKKFATRYLEQKHKQAKSHE